MLFVPTLACACSESLAGIVLNLPTSLLHHAWSAPQAPDEVRKKMADPFALGGFIPEFDRNGMKDTDVSATPRPRSLDDTHLVCVLGLECWRVESGWRSA